MHIYILYTHILYVYVYMYMYIYIYMLPPLMNPCFVLELSGIVVVSLQSFPISTISTILGHM